MNQTAKRLLQPLVAAVVAFALALAQPFYAADAMLGDALKQRPAVPSPQIMVIGIDEATLGEYGAFTTWSREKTAELLEFLYADPAQAPAVVAIDVIFQGQTSPATDERLARAAAKGTTVVAGNLVYSGTTKLAEDGQRVFDPWNIQGMETAYPALLEASSTGFADACISGDGVVRSALLFTQVDGQQVPSFATQAYTQYLRASGQLAPGQQPQLPATQDGICEFFYSAKSGEYQTISLNTVMSGAVPASEFAGKIVFLGAYASGMQDSYLTANGHTSTYGVEINANIVQALMDGRTAQPAPALPYALLTALAAFAVCLLAGMGGVLMAVLVCFGAAGVQLLLGVLLAGQGVTFPQLYGLIVFALILAACIMQRYVRERVQRRRAMRMFGQYVDPKVVEKLDRETVGSVQLSGEERDVSVLFVDVRGFTTMSEGLPPAEVVSILNEYLAMVTECIFRHGGMLDKYVGDCAMAVFNAPLDQDDYCYRSVACAWDIASGSTQLGERLQERFGRGISYGVGVHCGPAVVGNIGCEFRKDYTAIGDTVNTAARLEANAPRGEIYISRELLERLAGRVQAEPVGPLALKGKANAVEVFRVTGLSESGEAGA